MTREHHVIAQYVRCARLSANLSQEALGDLLGLTKGNISAWENGRHGPSPQQLAAVSRITGALLPEEIAPGFWINMDTKKTRLLRFRQLWREMFSENTAAMARQLNKSANQIRFYLNPEKPGGRLMGEDFAREAEAKLGKDKGWLDRERDNVDSLPSAHDDYARLMEAATMLKGWSTPTEVAAGLTARGYEVSQQTMNNWKIRGMSYEALLRAPQIIGCRPLWVMTGEGSLVDANNREIKTNKTTFHEAVGTLTTEASSTTNERISKSGQNLNILSIRKTIDELLLACGTTLEDVFYAGKDGSAEISSAQSAQSFSSPENR